MTDNAKSLTLDQWQALAVFRRGSGGMIDEGVASALERLGLVAPGWEVTEAGERAYAANRDRYAGVRPKRNFIG